MFPEPLQENDKVYVSDEEYGWLPARVLELPSENHCMARVRIELPKSWDNYMINKSERWIDLTEYPNSLLPKQNRKSVRDVADMEYIHEAPLLYQLREGHLREKPYTRVGDIIIAVNPCKWIDGLYSIDKQALYARNLAIKEAPIQDDGSCFSPSSTSFVSRFDKLGYEPHVYEISASSYRRVCEGVPQTILVTGESGAGKTETVKILLDHLELIEKQTHGIDVNSVCFERVLESFPIFEAFGNAKTSRNENSSRVGRVLKLGFSRENGQARLEQHNSETLLLESNRVVAPGQGERNFHIFYQLLSGTSDFKEEYLGESFKFAKIDDFKYLSETLGTSCNVDDLGAFRATLTALETFGFTEEALVELMQALACILVLGNLTFKETDNEVTRITSISALEDLSQRLGLDPSVIERMITHKKIVTSKEMVEVPLTAELSKEAGDSLAKRMYETVFNHVVSNLNRRSSSQVDSTLSVVDIYGFECFDTNRFDQLCINYVNEKLQQKYLNDIISRCTVEYKEEGIDLFDTSLFDNSERLSLLEGRCGILDAINEECVRPRGSTETMVRRIKNEQKDNRCLANETFTNDTDFTVVHFVGPVTYDAGAFLQRNSNKLSITLYELLGFCKLPIFNREYEQLGSTEQADAASVSERSRTVLNLFRNQVKHFLREVEGSESRYIRCIKPNETLKYGEVDHSTVLRQIRCSGIVNAIDLTAHMYPNSLVFETFLDRYSCLVDQTLLGVLHELPLYDRVQLSVSNLFSVFLNHDTDQEDFTMPYAIGNTKVFFRSGALEVLEAVRYEKVSEAARKVQPWARMVAYRGAYRRVRQASHRIQARYRGYRTEKSFLRVQKSTIMIQVAFRGQKARKELREKQASEKKRKYAILENEAAKVIAIAYKKALLRRKYAFVEDTIVLFQAACRGAKVRTQLNENNIIATDNFIEVRKSFDDVPESDLSGSFPTMNAKRDPIDEISMGIEDSHDTLDKYDSHQIILDTDEESIGLLSELSASEAENRNSELIARLQEELKRKDDEIKVLREEIHQVTANAEMHHQRIESEFEDRLLNYEEEVLTMKQKFVEISEENSELKERLSKSSHHYREKINGLQALLNKSQSGQKEYLNQILMTLEITEKTRKAETARLQSQIDRLRVSSILQ